MSPVRRLPRCVKSVDTSVDAARTSACATTIWLLLALLAGAHSPLLLAGDSGFRAHFLGGTIAELPSKSEGRISLTDEQMLVLEAGKLMLYVPYRKIETIEYGQHVSRRYAAAVLFSPMLKHMMDVYDQTHARAK